ncbi:SMP-30/gluconolactonase/LRE family protein [Legionella clemsonensis]|uniref:SMP-30/Gluconolaconase/LRE-like region n=1 Tax=Legionella clemsonensis TaxID=1867846 RepID=A0A222P640_9GAMM|nr:SMP-30/gluconolactonase/LRE family protein [Legionella clemsonensis]ASQ47321.1 SMP-30/Gluconolaconase/LRE-like region [Legionella clemsonensis]
MDVLNTALFLEGFQFTEGLRWHNHNLWFCDLWGNAVYCFSERGQLIEKISVDTPVGLGWLSDNSLLITSLKSRALLHYKHDSLSVYQSLAIAAPGYCHDFAVSKDDVVYLSASGFYPAHQVKPVKSNILMVLPDGKLKVAARNVGYPNGIIVTPDNTHVIVAETFAATVSLFDIDKNHTLVNQRPWVKFDDLGFQVSFDENGVPENLNRHYPDGISFDAKQNAVWVASPGKKEVLCIDANGDCLAHIKTLYSPFDCTLGGKNNEIVFIASTDGSSKNNSGYIEKATLNALSLHSS